VARGTSRAWFIVPAVLGLLLIWTIVSALSRDTPSSSHEGRGGAVVTLAAPRGGGKDAAPKLVERLVAMAIDAQVLESDEDRIRIALRRVADPAEAIAAATTPEPLSFYVVDEQAQHPPEQGDAASAEGDPRRVRPWLTGTSRADLRAKVERAGAPPGLTPLVECIPGPDRKGPPLCAAWLGSATRLTAAEVREIHLRADERTEEPLVLVTFTEEGASAFQEIARAGAGRMLVVVALGEVQARPRIPSEIQDGRWTFSTRTGDTIRPVAVDRARRIAAAANLSPLPPLVVQGMEEARAPK
jgi:preprotein translocase subunit SecD